MCTCATECLFVGNQINSSNAAFVYNSCCRWYHINTGWVPSGQHREVQLDLKTRFSSFVNGMSYHNDQTSGVVLFVCTSVCSSGDANPPTKMALGH